MAANLKTILIIFAVCIAFEFLQRSFLPPDPPPSESAAKPPSAEEAATSIPTAKQKGFSVTD